MLRAILASVSLWAEPARSQASSFEALVEFLWEALLVAADGGARR